MMVDVYSYDMPTGMIMLWYGAIVNIPDGWVLCDGNNGTPNLQDKFIVGAGDTYTVDDTGGSDEHTLDNTEIPSHDHGGVTDADNINSYLGYNSSRDVNTGASPFSVADNDNLSLNHSHVINAQGGGGAHENRPPFYALAYIMKT